MYSSIVEGEVVAVQEATPDQGQMILYQVEVYLPSGSLVILPNCQLASEYGGLGDYRRRRIRTRLDAEQELDSGDPLESLSSSYKRATVGERVLIAFVNNSIEYPVIIGFLSHENETKEDVEPSVDDGYNSGFTREVVQLNGLRTSIDENGNYRIVRKGAPEVSFEPKSTGSLGSFGAQAGGEGNPALSSLVPTELAAFELLEGGVFRAKDYSGGVFQLSSGQVLMSNRNSNTFQDITKNGTPVLINGVLSSFGPPQNESIQLLHGDMNIRGSKNVNITSGGKRVDITFGDEEQNVYGQLGVSVFGSVTRNIGGALTSLITGDYNQTVGGATRITTTGDMVLAVQGESVWVCNGGTTIAAVGDLTQSSGGKTQIYGNASALVKSLGGAGMNAVGGTIAIGAGGVELFDHFSQLAEKLIELITALETHKHLGNLGYPTNVPEAPEIADFGTAKIDITDIQAAIDGVKGDL